MYQISTDQITSWSSFPIAAEQVVYYPTALAVTCPHCSLRCGFNLEGRVTEEQVQTSAAIYCPCPICSVDVRFFVLDPSADMAGWSGQVWMHPAANERRILKLDGLVPQRVVDNYRNAGASYGHQLWRPAVQQARVVLEGIVKMLLQEVGIDSPPKNLSRALLNLAERADLASPIHRLGDALREGGNLASHFDDRGDVTQELATEMLDLLDAFIEYFVITPSRVDAVMQALAPPGEKGVPDGSGSERQ